MAASSVSAFKRSSEWGQWHSALAEGLPRTSKLGKYLGKKHLYGTRCMDPELRVHWVPTAKSDRLWSTKYSAFLTKDAAWAYSWVKPSVSLTGTAQIGSYSLANASYQELLYYFPHSWTLFLWLITHNIPFFPLIFNHSKSLYGNYLLLTHIYVP